MNLTRRAAASLLAAAAVPAAARAQPAQPPAQPPALPTLPGPQPAQPVAPAAPPAHPAPASALDPSKSYVVYFAQTIDPNSMRALRHQMAQLVEAGVPSVTLSMSCLGGSVDQALATYGFLRSLPMKVRSHAHGWVASAANVLFLAGDDRSADPTARFMFHPTTALVAGTLNGDQVQEREEQFALSEGTFAQIYRDRTRLSDPEIASFSHGQHFYSAAEAMDRGIVQSVGPLELPGDGKTRVLFLD